MRKSLTRQALCLATALCLLLSIAPVSARAATQDEIDQLQRQKEQLQVQRNEKQAVVDELEAQHAQVVEQKQAMDERNYYALQQLQINSEQIELYSQMIAEKGKEVDQARELEENQLQRYRARVRAMEERGSLGFLALVLDASNLGELLTIIDDVGEIMEYDRTLEDDYIAARENTESVLAEYEAYKAEIEGKQAELRSEQQELEGQIEEATLLIYELVTSIDSESEELDALNASINAAQHEIDVLVAELERQRAEEEAVRRKAEEEAAAAAGGGNNGGENSEGSSGGGEAAGNATVQSTGSFIWPVPSCTYITSRYGPRYHPVTGAYQSTHAGLDIGASHGATIVAADSGVVSLAGVNGGYGNCVMINHGNGYYTLYGHMSSIAVSEGQAISQGDTVGYVGSTGVSTGPHCHFEIRVNGATTDPAPWFGGLTYAPDA